MKYLWTKLLFYIFIFINALSGRGEKKIVEETLDDIPISEYNALYELYTATNGINWSWLGDYAVNGIPWNFTGLSEKVYNNPCADHWQGLECLCSDDMSICNVQTISLHNYSLAGALPNSLSSFSLLAELDVGLNQISSTLPESLGLLEHLEIFIVNLNNLISGSIPSGLYNALNMTYFDISNNIMTGSVSNAIGQWSNLKVLYLDHNFLTNTLPDSIGDCTKLTTMELEVNKFNGTIPDSWGGLSDLNMLLLYTNQLTGTIPSNYSTLSNLVFLELYNNRLEGPLSPDLCRLSKLKALLLHVNQLTGPLPDCIGDLISLRQLELYHNSFTGTVPESLFNLLSLEYLELYHNHFSGTISNSIGNCRNMTLLQLNYNNFDHTLPASVTNFKKLLILDVSDNAFTGYVPDNIGDLSKLQFLMLYGNQMTNSIPSSSVSLKSLTHLGLNTNCFDGTLPDLLSQLTRLTFFALQFNGFTGTIPDVFDQLSHIYYLSMYSNRFTGTIPRSISTLPMLQNVFLQANRLTGNIENVFSVAQTRLSNIDISVNLLTGTIPDSIYQLPAIATFAATSNCFSGSISEAVCSSTTITALVLDGLSTAESCRTYLFPNLHRIHTYMLLNSQDMGTIPSCLFKIPQLETLHLSGNGFSGSIPTDNIVLSKKLTDLALSHNELRGNIPDAVINSFSTVTDSEKAGNLGAATLDSWLNLDLSYNKLDGVISPAVQAIPAQETLSLQVNRLSGAIPQTLMSAKAINILDGNMFSCGNQAGTATGSDLPVHDQTSNIYECGSSSFNQASYIWISVVLFSACVAVYLLYLSYSAGKQQLASLQQEVSQPDDSNDNSNDNTSNRGRTGSSSSSSGTEHKYRFMRYLTQFHKWLRSLATYRVLYMSVYTEATSQSQAVLQLGAFLNDFRKVFILLTVFILIVLLPVYSVLTTSYGSYTHEYAWFYSIALISGRRPAAMIFLSLVFFVLVIFFLYDRYVHSFYQPSVFSRDLSSSTGESNGWCHWLCAWYSRNKDEANLRMKKSRYNFFVFCLIVLNCLAVMAVNGVYIYISINYNVSIVTMAQMALAVFKLVWNNVVVFDLYEYLRRTYFKPRRGDIVEQLAAAREERDLELLRESLPDSAHLSLYTNRSSYSNAVTGSSRAVNGDMMVQSFVLMFNNIASPCLAICFISSNCFYNAIFPSPKVLTSYDFLYCTNVLLADGTCAVETLEKLEASFLPPFIYSYQCSSVFITTYTSVYIYMFLLSTFAQPIANFVGMLLHKYWKKGTFWYRLVDSALPEMLKPLKPDDDGNNESGLNDSAFSYNIDNNKFDIPTQPVTAAVETSASKKKRFPPPLIKLSRYLVTVLCHLGILITFGALFPPLAVVICVSVLFSSHYLQVLVGRVLVNAEGRKYLSYLYRIDEECEDVQKAFKNIVYMLISFAVLFYAFFLFDILGDDVGWAKALWAPVAMISLPVVLYFAIIALNKLFRWLNNGEVTATGTGAQTTAVKYQVLSTTNNKMERNNSLTAL